MKFPRSQLLILMAIMVVALSQIMCNMPDKDKPLVSDLSSDEAVVLLELSVNQFEVGTQKVGDDQNCKDEKVPNFGPDASFEYDPIGVLTMNTNGESNQFIKTEPGKFCWFKNFHICISDLSPTGYQVTVEDLVSRPTGTREYEECFYASYTLTSITDGLLSEEIVNQVPGGDSEAESLPPDEANSDPPPQPVDPSESDVTVEDCLVGPDMYRVEFADLHRESDEERTLCRSTYTLFNFSDEQMGFNSYLVIDNADEHSEKWLLRKLNPGEEFKLASSYKTTDTNFPTSIGQFTKVIVFKNSAECNALMSEENEVLWGAYAVDLHCPCN